ncbi:zinc-binding metallopeptidase family protein [Pararhizobium haloflavum]|uniref:zinc-binding metallopeptidase family protein n=1 Tax=Pararhizobium haloflavum TaxID=2037914 RepID=UPI0018E4268B|nr:putative zinc-binding metallopeptidase [Pararhizobium haloflavum]
MRPFACPVCDSRLFFENSACVNCGSEVAFQPARLSFAATDTDGVHRCANHDSGGCNWMAERQGGLCLACDLNELIPPIDDDAQRRRWAAVEEAKRRLLYSVLRLNIPIYPKRRDPTGLSFRILVSAEHGGTGEVVMGHQNGVITIDATEADAHLREFRRAELDEQYRTLLGHMRHESGHYFWERLALLDGFLDAYRSIFGDEREDYGEALARHYENGPPADWADHHISAYATAHSWEDWAESFAHYLHVVDGVETGETFAPAGNVAAQATAYDTEDFQGVVSRWHRTALLMNAMNRSMGHHDYYPFIVNDTVAAKLAFIHRWLGQLRAA